MRLRSLLSVAAVAATFSASAQTWVADTITMGGTYAKDIYYHMGTGVVKEDSNNRWDLAFSAIPATAMTNPHYGVGAWINSAVSATGTPVRLYSLHKQASSGGFAAITGADTAGKLTTPLVNSEINYGIGAFNTNGNGAVGNYGWGIYNTATHNINGDSVYIAIKGTTAYKVWIEQYVAIPPTTWKFHVQKLDTTGNPEQVVTLNITTNYANRVMAYYSFANGAIDREPASNAWDLNFTRFTSMVSMGGPATPYPVAGVFINPYISVRRAWKATADTTHFANYTDTSVLNVIGRDWKTFNFTSSYILDTVNYFVKSNNGQYYQLEFTYASLSSAGKTAFRKRQISTTTAVNTINKTVANYYVAPVPANNQVSLMVDTKENTNGAVLMLTDLSGRTVYNQLVSVEKGMNTYSINTGSFPAGMYLLSLNGQNIKLAQKITVAH